MPRTFFRSQTLNPKPETGMKPHPEMDAKDFLRSQSLMRPFESPVIRRLPSPGDSTALTMLSFFSIAAQRGSRVEVSGLRVEDFGFKVEDFGLRASGFMRPFIQGKKCGDAGLEFGVLIRGCKKGIPFRWSMV